MSKISTTDPITPAQIDAWKEKYSGIFKIEVPTDAAIAAELALAIKKNELTQEQALETQNTDKIAELTKEVDLLVEQSEETLKAYFRRPTLEEIGVASAGAGNNAFKAAIALYNTAFLGGHPAFENDEEIKSAAIKEFKQITDTRRATVKKL